MKNVFIIEDYDNLRILIEKLIEKIDGFLVIGHANDGLDALERIPELAPDIITLDMGLPKFGGVELLRAIKQKSPTSKIIVISSDDDAIADAKQAGADSYLLKPFDNKTFQTAILAL